MIKTCNIFGDDQQNALYMALHNAAGSKDLDDKAPIYDYLEMTPRGSMTCEVVDALNELGYRIVKNE